MSNKPRPALMRKSFSVQVDDDICQEDTNRNMKDGFKKMQSIRGFSPRYLKRHNRTYVADPTYLK